MDTLVRRMRPYALVMTPCPCHILLLQGVIGEQTGRLASLVAVHSWSIMAMIVWLQGHFSVALVGSRTAGSSEMRFFGSRGALIINIADSSMKAYGDNGKVRIVAMQMLILQCWADLCAASILHTLTAHCFTVTLGLACRSLRPWWARATALLWLAHMRWASACNERWVRICHVHPSHVHIA